MSGFEKTPSDVRELLGKRISQLGLKLEGSPVERFVRRLQRELERKGLKRFKPVCYLTDEWGCPDGQPVIGIPFYLADPKLARLERAMNDLEDDREIMMYMRHEAGHAFNYAYRLFASPEWRKLFGPYNRRYRGGGQSPARGRPARPVHSTRPPSQGRRARVGEGRREPPAADRQDHVLDRGEALGGAGAHRAHPPHLPGARAPRGLRARGR